MQIRHVYLPPAQAPLPPIPPPSGLPIFQCWHNRVSFLAAPLSLSLPAPPECPLLINIRNWKPYIHFSRFIAPLFPARALPPNPTSPPRPRRALPDSLSAYMYIYAYMTAGGRAEAGSGGRDDPFEASLWKPLPSVARPPSFALGSARKRCSGGSPSLRTLRSERPIDDD